jgi:hypothetical protein
MGAEGDFKLYGRARDQQDDAVLDAYRATIRARIDWEPSGPFHLFAIDVESAGFTVFGAQGYAMAWDHSRGTRCWSQREE